jgi:hypothetical protein
MPQIIVTAGAEDGTVMLRERVNASDFESDRFAANLLERLGWAVEDATQIERTREATPAPVQDTEEPADYAWDPAPLGVA